MMVLLFFLVLLFLIPCWEKILQHIHDILAHNEPFLSILLISPASFTAFLFPTAYNLL